MFQKHYCKNEVKNEALFVKAKPCHDQKTMKHCPMHPPADDQDKKGCCDNKAEYLKLDTDQVTTVAKIDLKLPIPQINALFTPAFDLYSILDTQTLHYLNYKPPLLIFDLPVYLQTFRC